MYKNFYFYKNKILAISLIAIFAMSIAMTFAPTTLAQKISAYPVPRVTDAYANAAPTLIGVGQQLTINLWVEPPPQDAAGNGNIGLIWHGFVVTFTRPDGTKDTFTPTDQSGLYAAGQSDPLGGMWFYYKPNMAGNWSMSFTMPAQNLTSTTAQAFVGTAQFAGSTSNTAYFTVTTEQQNAGILNGWPYAPLPNSNVYWTYPINSNNREWSTIAGNWLAVGNNLVAPDCANYQPYGSAPSTGHILWDQQEYLGGIVGGDFGSISYVGYGLNLAAVIGHVIMDGRLYVNRNTADNKFDCFDLTTGKLLYTATGTINNGIILPGNDYAQAVSARGGTLTGATLGTSYGAAPTPYLFSAVAGSNNAAGLATTVWNYYDPLNGALRLSITNVTAPLYNLVDGTVFAYGQTYLNFNATTDKYDINYAWGWNITKVTKNDWYTGLLWKTQLNGPGPRDLGIGDGSARTAIFISADLSTVVLGASQGDNWAAGFDTQTGKWLWNLTLPQTAQRAQPMYNSNNWVIYFPNSNTFSCYDMRTGTLRWSTSNVGTYPYNTRGVTRSSSDGTRYYISMPSGEVAALDYATGKVVWLSKAIPTTESAANVLAYWEFPVVAGGYVYVYAGYSLSYEIDPIQRFSMLVAINATTGEIAWTENGGIAPQGAANGYLTGLSFLDGKVYVLGKGQTSTSVTVPNNVNEGVRVQIQGNVLDQSPAQAGTPAVSDSSMSEQMDYLHMQNATLLNNPPKGQGVTVTLTAVDPNNNTVTIGTTTTNSEGNYYFNWTPSMTGSYVITASFAGSGSYWPSTAQTGTVVNAAPTATSSTSVTTTSSGITETTLYTAVAAIIIVVIIASAAIIILQRKRP